MSNNNNQTLTVDDLVRREVVLCVSYLIGALQAEAEHFPDVEDDLLVLAFGPVDYEGAATAEGWERLPDGLFRNFDGRFMAVSDSPSWQALCFQQDIEPYRQEVRGHWVVSSSLAADLVRHGETVVDDILGLGPVWARATPGRAIYRDYVIGQVYRELMERNT